MTSFRNLRNVLGAVITLSCIRVSSCTRLPRLPDHMNLMEVPTSTGYVLDAKEKTDLFPGQVAAFTCSDIEVPGTITHWLKDGAEVASTKLLSKEVMERLYKQYIVQRDIGLPPRLVQSSFPLKVNGLDFNTTSSQFTVLRNGILYLHKVTKFHEGKYSCLVEECYGKILRRQFDLTVTDAPRCSLQPTTKQYLYRRSNTRLQCSLNFKNMIARLWKKDGKEMNASSSSKKFNSLENGALHIFDLKPEDSGNYTCHVRTPIGWISCGPVELLVSDEDVRFDASRLYDPINVTVQPPYDTAELECLVNNVNVTYAWARPAPDRICGGRMCPENRLDHSPRGNNLILKKVSSEDMGYYECLARIPDDSNTEKTSLYLNVLTKPEITVEYRSKVVLLARRIKITCAIGSSNPPAKVFWVKDGERTDTMKGRGILEELENDIAFLTIESAEYSHRGHYQCVAYNGVGIVSSETFLNIPEDHAQIKNHVLENTARNFMLTDLHPFTNYAIKVTALSSKSPSETAVIRIRTPEGKIVVLMVDNPNDTRRVVITDFVSSLVY